MSDVPRGSAGELVALIRAAEDERYAAMLAGDSGRLAGLLSGRLAYMHSSGHRDGKDSLLAKISKGALAYVAIEHPVSQVIALGDTVLVTGEMRGDILVDNKPKHIANDVLAVWGNEDGTWRLIAFQPTPLPA